MAGVNGEGFWFALLSYGVAALIVAAFAYLFVRWLRKGWFLKWVIGALFGLLLAAFGYTEWNKARLDAEVNRLCAKDGGVKVYEQVKLPAERFDKWGMVNFYQPDKRENALGLDYVVNDETTYYRRGNPELFRMHMQIMRRSDGKLLGESVFYKRGGGDLPGPWYGSSFLCPELNVANDVLRQVFIKE